MRGEGEAGADARLRFPAISELTPCSPTPLFHAPPTPSSPFLLHLAITPRGELLFSPLHIRLCYVRVGGHYRVGGLNEVSLKYIERKYILSIHFM